MNKRWVESCRWIFYHMQQTLLLIVNDDFFCLKVVLIKAENWQRNTEHNLLSTVKFFQHVSFESLLIDVMRTEQLHDFEISKSSLKMKKTSLITKTTTKNWTCTILSPWNFLQIILSHSSTSSTSSSETLSFSSISSKSLSETLSPSSILSRQISWNSSRTTLWHSSILSISNSLYSRRNRKSKVDETTTLSFIYVHSSIFN